MTEQTEKKTDSKAGGTYKKIRVRTRQRKGKGRVWKTRRVLNKGGNPKAKA